MGLFVRIRKETLLLFALLFCVCTVVIWVRTETVKATYKYVKQERELSLLSHEIQSTRVKWLKQTAPARLESLAPSFDLYAPTMEQIIKAND